MQTDLKSQGTIVSNDVSLKRRRCFRSSRQIKVYRIYGLKILCFLLLAFKVYLTQSSCRILLLLKDPVSQVMFWHLEPMGTALVDPLPYTAFYPDRRTLFGSGFFVYPTIHFSLYEPFNEVFFILEYKTLWQCRNISHPLKFSLQNL